MAQKTSKTRKSAADKIISLPIGEIRPYENNPRKNADAVKYVKESIRQFGFKIPIVIDSDRVIVCGHTRLLAAKSLGLSEVPCIMVDDLTEDQVKALRLADNKVSEFSEWDLDLLGAELESLAGDCDLNMCDFGFFDESEKEKDKEETQENGVDLTPTYQIIIECSDEMEQQDIFERLSSEGLKCRRLAPL